MTNEAFDRTFRAMGSDAHVIVVGGGPHYADLAVRRIADLESRWSRFLADSEVSELNRHAGEAVVVSADTLLLVERAKEAWRLSAGAFDPTVLGAVVGAGYDRSFELVAAGSGAPAPAPAQPLGLAMLGVGADDIEVDRAASTVRLPDGIGFDPGGIGKGLAADLVVGELRSAGADGVCVNLGGDLRVAGCSPNGAGWTVDVEHPHRAEPIARVGVWDGAVATSTTLRRRWFDGSVERHHLIDPATGLPSTSDLDLATVIAGDGWMAEVLAKAVLLAGSDYPFDILGGTGASALAVSHDGTITMSAGFADYV